MHDGQARFEHAKPEALTLADHIELLDGDGTRPHSRKENNVTLQCRRADKRMVELRIHGDDNKPCDASAKCKQAPVEDELPQGTRTLRLIEWHVCELLEEVTSRKSIVPKQSATVFPSYECAAAARTRSRSSRGNSISSDTAELGAGA